MRLILLLCLSVFNIYGAGQFGGLDPGGIVRSNTGVELNMALSPVTINHNGYCYTVTCSEASCATKTLYAPTTSSDEMETFVNYIGQNVSGISVTSVSGTCGGSYSWDYEVPTSASCEYGCLKLGSLRCKNSSGAFVADSSCVSILASKPTANEKYIADSSCGTQGPLNAPGICSTSSFIGYNCIPASGVASMISHYNVGSSLLNGRPYESPSYASVQGTKTNGTMYDNISNTTTDCNISSPEWIPTGIYGSCQANCEKYEGRTCSTGNDADCNASEPIPSVACAPGQGLCPSSCTYPSNVSSVQDCSDACPSGPTKMCATGSDPNPVICPFGETCRCQAGNFCLIAGPDPGDGGGDPSCHCRGVPVTPDMVCQGSTINYPDSCGNNFACPVVGTAPNAYGDTQATQCLSVSN